MTDLITLEEYKLYKSISNPKDDARISAIIASVSQLVKTYCANSLIDHYNTPYTEAITVSWESPTLILSESPVRSISEVKERANPSESYTTLTSSDYYLDPLTDALIRVSGTGMKNWPKGPVSVEVTYTAGYQEVPADLKLAVIDLITYYFKEEYKSRQTLSGATMERAGTTSKSGYVSFPDHIKRVLDLYKNFV